MMLLAEIDWTGTGGTALIVCVAAISIAMLFAQLRLFRIAQTLEDILKELRNRPS